MKKLLTAVILLSFILLISCNDASIDTDSNKDIPKPYTVSFDLNGGNGNIPNQYLILGQTIAEPEPPAKDGYIFAGWTSNGEYWDFINDLVRDDVALVAQYAKDDGFVFKGVDGECILEKYIGNESIVVVPSYYDGMRVRGIGTSAFKDNKTISEVVLPETLISIGYSAFENCTNLKKINLPTALQILNTQAFKDCYTLNEIKYDCINLNDLKEYNLAFYDAGIYGKGINVVVGNQVKRIPSYLFDSKCESRLNDQPYYKGDTKIPKIVSVNFEPSSVCEEIGKNAFDDCNKLKEVNLPSSIKVIGDCSFYRCTGLEKIVLPAMVEDIQRMAFCGCTSLKSVNFPSQILSKQSIKIGDGGFSNCKSLLTVDFKDNPVFLGSGVFNSCIALESADLGDNVTVIPDGTFQECENLKSINMNDTVTDIGEKAFYRCSMLKLEKLPSFLKSIGSYSFDGCDSIEELVIPKNVTYIGMDAFSESGLKTVIMECEVERLSRTFSYCAFLEKVVLCDTVTYMDFTFVGCKSLKAIALPASLVKLDYSVFDGCEGLEKVTFNSALKEIGYACFKNCKLLKEISLPYGLEKIDRYAFANCDLLLKIWIPKTVTELKNEAFENSSSVKIYAQIDKKPDKWESGFYLNVREVLWSQENMK